MRALFALPWHYWVFTCLVCVALAIFGAMHQQDANDNFRDRPVVIALGGIAAILAWVTGITGLVKFVMWWRG